MKGEIEVNFRELKELVEKFSDNQILIVDLKGVIDEAGTRSSEY